MKHKIILAVVCLLFTNLTYAQDINSKDVPSVVLNSFNKSFPKASKVEWERKGDAYNADFDIDWRDHEVWISNTGAIIKHKQEIKAEELPAVVASQIKKNYGSYRIDDIDKYEVKKQFFYKIELKKHDEERKIVLDQKGQLSMIDL